MITEKEPLMELVRQLTGVLEKMDLKDSSRNEILKIKMGLQAILQENKVSDISAEEYINKKQLQFNTYTSEGVITKQGLIKHLKEYASIVNDLPIELFDLAFESWANKQNWQLHSSNEYYYRSKNMHSWPPDETIEIADLKKQFMKYISIVNERKEPFGYVCNNMFFKDISGKTFIADEDKPIAVYVDKSNDNIPADFKQVPGHDSPKEMIAYEKGREDEQEVIMKWIEQWDGSTNSAIGALLKKKFDESKDKGVSDEELENIFNSNFDCYADTRQECDDTIPPILIEGEVIQAMTKESFKKVVKDFIINERKDNIQVLCAICGKSITETGTSYKGKPVHIGCYHKAKNERKDKKLSATIVDGEEKTKFENITEDQLNFLVKVDKILRERNERKDNVGINDAIEFAEFLGEQNRICFLGADNVRRWHKLIGGTPLTTEELYKIFKTDHS